METYEIQPSENPQPATDKTLAALEREAAERGVAHLTAETLDETMRVVTALRAASPASHMRQQFITNVLARKESWSATRFDLPSSASRRPPTPSGMPK